MKTLTTCKGSYKLDYFPKNANKSLQPWDAADEYLFQYYLDNAASDVKKDKKILIVNDTFGALSILFSELNPYLVTDSFVSCKAIKHNLKINDLNIDDDHIHNSLKYPNQVFDYVLIKIPKSNAFLEDQLFRIRSCCDDNTKIIGAAMSRHIHTSTIKLFEKVIGKTSTSLAIKKSRLLLTEYDSTLNPGELPFPVEYSVKETSKVYLNHASVFSRDKLDIGARLMLKNIPVSEKYHRIVDLACGNGVLGIEAAELNETAEVLFMDESYMAVESAKINSKQLNNPERCEFIVSDCLQGVDEDSVDLVINNPPFHQHHAIGDFIAWKMFTESRSKLITGGEIRVVANRHLGYHLKLKKIFGNCEVIDSDKKFVILQAFKK